MKIETLEDVKELFTKLQQKIDYQTEFNDEELKNLEKSQKLMSKTIKFLENEKFK